MTMKPTLKLDKKQKAFALLTDEQLTRALHALQRFERRSQGQERPAGSFDRAKRWYPTDAEDCGVTTHTRSPSREWPFSYLKACLTLKHCIALEEADSDDVRVLKAYLARSFSADEQVSYAHFQAELLRAERLSLSLPVAEVKQPSKRL